MSKQPHELLFCFIIFTVPNNIINMTPLLLDLTQTDPTRKPILKPAENFGF